VFGGRESTFPIYRVRSNGSGLIKLVERNGVAADLTPDGRTVLVSVFGPGVHRIPLDGGRAERVSDRNAERAPYVSPDGRRIMFLTDEGERGEERTRPVSEQPPRERIGRARSHRRESGRW